MIGIYGVLSTKSQKLKTLLGRLPVKSGAFKMQKWAFCNAKSLNFKGKTMLFRTKRGPNVNES